MATNTEHGSDSGSINPSDMAEHTRTWKGFVRFMTWQALGAAVVLALLAIFRTHG
jgi:aa3 type cytochrome c oxidase subunit IV